MTRYNTYASIHRALRAFMGDTLAAVGRMDPHDDGDVHETLARLDELLELCESHAHHEDEFFHCALEARAPGCSARFAADHVALGERIEELRALAARRAPELYRRLAVFVADNFTHMEEEESAANALLWAHFTDDEIRGIEARLVRALPPGATMQVMRWMIPAVEHDVRLEMFERLAHAPRGQADALLALARSHLRPAEWRKLEGALAQRAAEATVAS